MAKLRIVVADDNPAFLQKLTSLLAVEFDVVATATDGQSALSLIHQYKPDVVVLDLDMPVLNGIQVTRELAQTSKNPCVVICSVEADAEVVEAAQLAGAFAYVFKIGIEKDLIPAVKSALRRQFFVSSGSQ